MPGQRAKGIREGDGLGKGYLEPPGMGILETCGDLGTWMRVSQDTSGSPQVGSSWEYRRKRGPRALQVSCRHLVVTGPSHAFLYHLLFQSSTNNHETPLSHDQLEL